MADEIFTTTVTHDGQDYELKGTEQQISTAIQQLTNKGDSSNNQVAAQAPVNQGLGEQLGNSFKDTGIEAARSFQKSGAGILSALDYVAKAGSKATGIPSSGTFGQMADQINQGADAMPETNLNPVAKFGAQVMGEAPAMIGVGGMAGQAGEALGVLGKLVGKAPTPWGELGEAAGQAAVKSKEFGKALKWKSTLDQANKAGEALEAMKDTIGKGKALALEIVKDSPAEFNFINHPKTPNIVFDALKRPEYGIEFAENGNIKQTVGNLDKIKGMLGDLNRAKWDGKTTIQSMQIERVYGAVRQSMINGAEKASEGSGAALSKSMDAYSNFMDHYHAVKPVIMNRVEMARSNGLKSLFKPGAEQNVQAAFHELGKVSPEVRQVVGVMKRNQLLKNLLKVGGVGIGAGAVYGGVKSGFNAVKQAITDSGDMNEGN